MIITDIEKLDNPAWFALSETHQQFSISYDKIKFYHPDYCPFGAFVQKENISYPVSEYSKLTDNFFIIGEKPEVPVSLILKNEMVCLQMIINRKVETVIKEDIVLLGKEQADELFQLVNLVQPGYFKSKTFLLGNYYGIYKNDQLIAVTGERMQMNKFIEVSAVVTHPLHTGKGYARQLVTHTVNKIFEQDKIPILHVTETNAAAISLYEKLGFQKRRRISFWNIIK